MTRSGYMVRAALSSGEERRAVRAQGKQRATGR
jgi:hypothetical protein